MTDELIKLKLELCGKNEAIKKLNEIYGKDQGQKIYSVWDKWYKEEGYKMPPPGTNAVANKRSICNNLDQWVRNKVRRTRKDLTKMDFMNMALSYGNSKKVNKLHLELKKRGLNISKQYITVVSKEAHDKGLI